MKTAVEVTSGGGVGTRVLGERLQGVSLAPRDV